MADGTQGILGRRVGAALGAGAAGLALLLLVLGSLVAGGPVARAQAPDACPGNLVTNPGFESGFTARGRPGELVANGWQAWYKTLPGVGGLNYVPDYQPRRRDEGPSLTPLAGLWSQELATSDATHTGGIFQRAALPEGGLVLASARAYAWASQGDDPAHSRPSGRYRLQVGVDAFGGTDPERARVRWSEAITVTDAWVPLSLVLPVAGPELTLFLRGEALERMAHNASRWDEVCLRVLGPAAGPVPSETPSPTATRPPRITATPTDTPNAATAAAVIARFAPTATPTVEEGIPGARATLAVLATRLAGGATGGGTRPATVPPALAGTAEPAGARPGLSATLQDQAGLLFLGLAAFLGGLWLAVGRGRRTAP